MIRLNSKKLCFITCIFLPALLAVLLLPALSEAFNPKHLDYNGCNTCHTLHSSPGGTLFSNTDKTEDLCNSCHGPGGIIDTVASAIVHNPASVAADDLPGWISCRECHDSHSNEYGNIKQVGYDWDPFLDPSKSVTYNVPTIREELTTSDYNSPVYKQVTFQTRDDFSRGDGLGACEACHSAGPTSGPTVLQNHDWGDCVVCHMHEDGFRKRQCVECHDVNATLIADAPQVVDVSGGSVSAVGSHLRINGSDPIVGLTDLEWTVQCIECHTGHSGDVMIPNYNAVGIDYQKTGGIGLGGAATLVGATTEADICWDCHGAGQSEWNALTDHGIAVSGGDDWTAVSFNLDGTTVPTTTTRSMHSGDSTLAESVASSVTNNIDWNNTYGNGTNALVPDANAVLEDVADIRCSYCHDVHDLNAAPSDATTGEPYLRGSWLHNPYVATDIERPPESGDSWIGNQWSHFDSGDTVPRLRTDVSSANTSGGYQIDQNNNYPTASYLNSANLPDELTDTAGLCVLCHGTDVDGMDYFTTQNLWNSPNGHANAVLGGSGYNAVSLFDARNRDGQLSTAMGFFMAGQGADVPNIDRWGKEEIGGNKRFEELPYGDNAKNVEPDDNNESGVTATYPRFTGYYSSTGARNTDNMPANYTSWYSSSGIGTANSSSGRAHDFSCSKCHTPHASRLPALLITNCLDYTITDWSETASGPKNGSSVTLGPSATNRWAVEAMNNCHRKKNTTTGWNVLAPEQ